MFRTSLGILSLVVCSLAAVHAGAEEALTQRLTALVEQLGDASFDQRQAAERELRNLGIPALPPLLVARDQHDDLEVRRRAERIVPEIEAAAHAERLRLFQANALGGLESTIPGWQRLQKLIGDKPEARRLFVEMHRAEPKLMLACDEKPERLNTIYGERVAEMSRPMRQGTTAEIYQLRLPAVLALLFTGSRDDLPLAEQLAQHVSQTAQGPAVSNLLANTAASDNEQRQLVKQILSAWITQRSQGWAAMTNLHVATRFDLREPGLKVSRELIQRPGKQPSITALALSALERFGNRDDIALAESCLGDQGLCLRFTRNTQQLSVEVREVALAVAVLLSGEKLADFGYGELQRIGSSQLVSINSLELGDSKKIEAAIQQWQARSQRVPTQKP